MDFRCSFATSSPSTAKWKHAKTLVLRSDFKDFYIRCFDVFFCFSLACRCSAAPQNGRVCAPILNPSPFLKTMKNCPKMNQKTYKNRSKSGCKIWLRLGIVFFSFFLRFRASLLGPFSAILGTIGGAGIKEFVPGGCLRFFGRPRRLKSQKKRQKDPKRRPKVFQKCHRKHKKL